MALRGALTHRKTRKLALLLGIDPPHALGLMEALWHATADTAPNGGIGRISDEDMAMAIFYSGDARALVAAMVNAGFLDRDDRYRLIVHNWHRRCDDAVDNRLARSLQLYANGAMPRMTKLSKKEREELLAQMNAPPAPVLPFPLLDAVADSEEENSTADAFATVAEGEEATCAQKGTCAHVSALPEPVPDPVPVPSNSPTPLPSQRGISPPLRKNSRRLLAAKVEAAKSTGPGQALDRATEHVLEKCSVSGLQAVHLHVPVWLAIESECKRVDKPPEDHAMSIAELMVANYAEYVQLGELLEYRWGIRKFFEEGHWRNWQAWPIDRDKQRQRNGASVGAYVN
jgi:hypothetical protein